MQSHPFLYVNFAWNAEQVRWPVTIGTDQASVKT
jgi:hypothetical protein